MPDTPDLDKMARNYLDLWQEHLTTISRDGETMDVLARTVALMNSGAAAFASAAEGYTPDGRTPGDEKPADTKSASNGVTKPETTGPAHEPASPDLTQCLERIAILEKRVADLEEARRKKPSPRRKTTRKS